MKKKGVFSISVLTAVLFCALCLASCAKRPVSLAGLETEQVKEVRSAGGRSQYFLKQGATLRDVCDEWEKKYEDDETLSFALINDSALAVSRVRLNKFDKRTEEKWIFASSEGGYFESDCFAEVTDTADAVNRSSKLSLPIKHMKSPAAVYAAQARSFFVYQNVKYPIAASFETIYSYYERLGFYAVERDGEHAILLTLKRGDDDLLNFADESFQYAFRMEVVEESVENGGNYFKITDIILRD